MKNFSSDAFNNALNITPFYVCDVFDDIDDRVWAYNCLYTSVLDEHAPVKTKTVSNKQVPHMNSKLRKAMHQRNMWRNRHFKNRRDKITRSHYVRWRNEVVRLNNVQNSLQVTVSNHAAAVKAKAAQLSQSLPLSRFEKEKINIEKARDESAEKAMENFCVAKYRLM